MTDKPKTPRRRKAKPAEEPLPTRVVARRVAFKPHRTAKPSADAAAERQDRKRRLSLARQVLDRMCASAALLSIASPESDFEFVAGALEDQSKALRELGAECNR